MVNSVVTRTGASLESGHHGRTIPKITIFHCFNAVNDTAFLEGKGADFSEVKMPCSSLIREVHLLRAFEAGADAVIVLACPEGQCRYIEGNLRAAKRVARVKKLLDEIGIGGRRLNLYNVPGQDEAVIENIVEDTIAGLAALGPNPAA